MKDRDVLMLLTFGLFALGGRRRVDFGAGWQWPLANVNAQGRVYHPFITQEFKPIGHLGVDIAFPRHDSKDLAQAFPPGTENGGKRWFAPPHVPVLAAKTGIVWSSLKMPNGWQVVVDHGKLKSVYLHLETTTVGEHQRGVHTITRKATPVAAGTVLGFMGSDPTDPEHVRHLHFEVHDGTGALDVDDAMKAWPYAPTTILVA